MSPLPTEWSKRQGMRLARATVVLVLPHRQFNEVEYLTVRSRLEAEGCRIRVMASSAMNSIGIHGLSVKKDLIFSEFPHGRVHALVFIGGAGVRDYWDHPRVHNLVRFCHMHNVLLAAICIAPVIFSRAGILQNRQVSCHPSVCQELAGGLIQWSHAGITVEGSIITASGPEHAGAFSDAIVQALLSLPAFSCVDESSKNSG